ncbi:MAG: hypothetical protein D6720_13150 [Gammaproteobacteria bacterium]|nr:MAG: hypothetical protein D6720_13150 [Gammaproteobacteria bacterium]
MSSEKGADSAALTLPFDPEEVAGVRLRQAEIARLFGVTPAAVSQWVKRGKISTFPDGRIDPNRAARELAKNCDLNRLRAKPFRPLRQELEQLRERVRDLRQERAALIETRQALEDRLADALAALGEQAAWLDLFLEAVRRMTLPRAADAEAFQAAVQEAFDAAGEVVLSLDRAAKINAGEQALADPFAVDLEAKSEPPPLVSAGGQPRSDPEGEGASPSGDELADSHPKEENLK